MLFIICQSMEFKKHKNYKMRFLVSAPLIYSLLGPFVLLDIFVEIYHRICFPLYGLKYVKRWDYIKIDRHHLKYLKLPEKLNCMYCGYANGLLAYVSKIAGETEKYWCGIKHKNRSGFNHPEHHEKFLPFNDEKSFIDFIEK